jgi:small-conductance mechanosensitive channel
MPALLRALSGLLLGLVWLCAFAEGTPVEVNDRPATLNAWNRDIIELRATVNGATPEERVVRARERIFALSPLSDPASIASEEIEIGGLKGRGVFVRNTVLFLILPQDLDPSSGETMDQVAQRALSNLRALLEARARQSRPRLLLEGAAMALGATVVMVGAVWLIGLARRGILRGVQRLHRRAPSGLLTPAFIGYVTTFEALAVRFLTLVAGLVVVYLWLAFVLSRFPYTAPWGARLGHYLVDLLTTFATKALGAIPGLFAAIVIFFIARAAARAVSRLLARVEEGRLSIGWLDRETAKATRWVVLTMIWLFAIIVAYPYIPGSDSLAFKGVSVFAGLMLTIGSSGFVAHILSGLIVVFSKAMRTGEMVKVGDTMGIVSDIGAFSTRIVTARGEEVNIPNSVLVGSTTTNFSRLAGDRGALLTTTVTIGYDAAWRQVHSLLELAAARTPGLRSDPKPYVLQRALGDFYVQYELRAHLQRTETWFAVQSELHARIQDVFNEYGVQIMSPHFMLQPDKPVVVPKSDWYSPPANQADGVLPTS